MLFLTQLRSAFRRHWSHYLAEALGIGFFVTNAGLLTTLLEHPASPVRQALQTNDTARHWLMGLAMGVVIVLIVYSPWGKKSGAHINPAVTLAFWQLGKIRTADAVWYVLAQVAGAISAAQLLKLILGKLYAHPTVNYTVTQPVPLPRGVLLAFAGEFVISFILMLVLLLALHSKKLKELAGWLIGALLALYIVYETPYSGMSLNPARTLGSAVAAGEYYGMWVYWVAPSVAMWLATVLFRRFHHGENLQCAIVAGCSPSPSSPHSPGEEPPQYPNEGNT
ncbi:aquaporin family protein [Hymenobacter taeanensis]|uniref:Aquaporin family protein n=1 Tax=Hymenobacter taeanensis TaxID=2735321 RepID=A0A6M6BF19_9BACT|nr:MULTISPECIES: aquaporin [Hymenobacter]QJX46549.1 aquaporin family protein [Hymenobacter taeanensis]UOQ80407.1 aquaporin [Hymenobacter sp. 5414T-23]